MTRLRAAMHVHSDWSYDGKLSLADVAALFARHHYDVVFMCEHDRGFSPARKAEYDVACAEVSTDKLLLVPGIEYADAEDRVHVPVWGAIPFLGEGSPTAQVLEASRAHQGASVIAHPRRREAWRVIEPGWLELATGLEIWTRKWDGWAANAWAVDQARASSSLEVVSLDLHAPGQMFPLAMELELHGARSVEACVSALRTQAARPLIGAFPVAPLLRGTLGRAAHRLERVRRPLWRRGRLIRDRVVNTG